MKKGGNKLVTSRAATGTPLTKANVGASAASDGDFMSTWGVSAKSTVVRIYSHFKSGVLFLKHVLLFIRSRNVLHSLPLTRMPTKLLAQRHQLPRKAQARVRHMSAVRSRGRCERTYFVFCPELLC